MIQASVSHLTTTVTTKATARVARLETVARFDAIADARFHRRVRHEPGGDVIAQIDDQDLADGLARKAMIVHRPLRQQRLITVAATGDDEAVADLDTVVLAAIDEHQILGAEQL